MIPLGYSPRRYTGSSGVTPQLLFLSTYFLPNDRIVKISSVMPASSSSLDELVHVQAMGLDTKSASSNPATDKKAPVGLSSSASSSTSHLPSLDPSTSFTPTPSEPRTPASENNEQLKQAYIDITAPIHSDLLTDYNTIRNTDIPAPLWARLDNDYREWKGIEAGPENAEAKLAIADVGDGILRAADGRPLRRVPAIRAIKEWEESDEDKDEDGDGSKQVVVPPPPQSLKKLKEAAAKRRETDPSGLTMARKEAEARVEAAREAKSEELEKIERWDDAVRRLNLQRDLVVVERMKALEGGKKQGGRLIQGVMPQVDEVDDDESRFEEF